MSLGLHKQNKQIKDHIQKYGWHCLHVFPTQEGQDEFTYSIGFAESFGSPEVVIFGLPREKAQILLGVCAKLLEDGHVIRPDVEDTNVLKGGYKVVFKSIRTEFFGEYLGTAERYYQGRPFGAVVMFLPDKEQRFPWQVGYSYIPAHEALAIVQAFPGQQGSR